MAGEIEVRLARVDEQPELQALQLRAAMADAEYRQAVLRHGWAMQLSVELVRRDQVFVAERQGRVAGLATVIRRQDGDVELEGLFVEPALWRKGIGRRLVERCVTFARGVGAGALFVFSRIDAEGFYLASGFETLGPGQMSTEPGVQMRMTLGDDGAGRMGSM